MKKINNIVGLIEIIGGCIGIIAILLKYTRDLVQLFNGNNNLTLIFILISAILYIVSIISGYLLLKGTDIGLKLSIVTQIVQLVEFMLGSLRYLFVSGLSLSFGILNKKLVYSYHIGSSFNIAILLNNSKFDFKVNVLALALIIYFIWQLKNKKIY